MNQTILHAIKEKRRLSFTYDGFWRSVEPHVYGVSKKNEELILAYQAAGGHISGHNEPWNYFTVSKIKSLGLSGPFNKARDEYRKGAHSLAPVFAEIEVIK